MLRCVSVLIAVLLLQAHPARATDAAETELRYFRTFGAKKHRPELLIDPLTPEQARAVLARGHSLIAAEIRKDGKVASVASINRQGTLWRSDYFYDQDGVLLGGRNDGPGLTKIFRYDVKGRPVSDAWYDSDGKKVREFFHPAPASTEPKR